MGNKVVLIGTEHYNLLGLVRSFGTNGIRPYGVLINVDRRKKFVSKSKFWEKTWVVESVEEGIELAIRKFGNEKVVLIPTIDKAALYIDQHLNELNKFFILGSIKNKQGAVAKLMEKDEQVSFIREIGFDSLDSVVVDLENPSEVPKFPIIMKPVASAEGQKIDIRIVSDKEEMKKVITSLRNLGYTRTLAQHFLTNKKEYVITGAICDKLVSYALIENERIWPLEKGTGCYSLFSQDKELHDYSVKLLNSIARYGYSGPIDIELFRTEDGKIYVNEINWRSSGRNFVSQHTKVYSVYLWYRLVTGQGGTDMQTIYKGSGSVMTESSDIKNIFAHKVSALTWVIQFINSSCYALIYHKDLKPLLFRFMH